MAVQSELIAQLLPGFETENHSKSCIGEVPPRAWIGNRIRVAPHYDLRRMSEWSWPAAGASPCFLPDQLLNLYPGPFELTPAGTPISMVDPHHPDLDRFPRFAEAMRRPHMGRARSRGTPSTFPFTGGTRVDSLDPVNLFINYWWSDAPAGIGRSV